MADFGRGFSRREFGALTLMAIPGAKLAARGTDKIDGVEIGAITYSFRSLPAAEMIQAMRKIGLTEVEVMSNHVEALAGAPSGGRDAAARDALAAWRKAATPATFKTVVRQFDTADIDVRLLCYNVGRTTTDDELDYAFRMAKALGVSAMSTSTQVSMAKRIAPFANRYKMRVGFHGHSNVTNPDEVATPESFATVMAASDYHCVNLDIGHFTAANFDAVAYLTEHHARITNLHLKDRKKNQGDNVPWGQGDTPIVPVLQLLKKTKWKIPANIEYEYRGADTVAEVGKCFEFCKAALKQ